MAIIVTELPYQVNKASLLEKIAELVKDKKVDGIGDLRDESDRDGMRILHRAQARRQPASVLNNLFKHTPMQLAFNMNMLALVDGQPQTLPLAGVLVHYLDHRREIIRRRTEFDLEKARARAHILEGLKIALDNLDAVIKTIRESADVEVARSNLMSRFDLSEQQAQASSTCGSPRWPRSSARRSRRSTSRSSSSSPSSRTSSPTRPGSARSSRTS
jgi:DNA gyrase subunit A